MKKYAKQTALALAAALTVTSAAPASVSLAATTDLKKATVTKTMTVGIGYKKKISVTKVPKNTKITYVSKNKKVAEVSKKGYVKGKKTGTSVVSVKLTYKKKTVIKKCKVTVKKAVTGISLAKKTISLNVGSTYQIKKTIKPSSSLQKVSYTSSKKSVATVSSAGKVKAKKAGTAKITVKALDGSNKKAVLTVKVSDKKVPATATPTTVPTTEPTTVPTTEPTTVPSAVPTTGASATPTTVPTSVPTGVPTTAPTVVPTTAPTEAPTTAPTAVPTTTPAQNVKTITAADLDANKAYTVSGAYDKVVISSNVGDDAKITIADGANIKALTMQAGAGYTIDAKQAAIGNVEVVEAGVATQSVKAKAAGKVPTFNVSAGTEIVTIRVETEFVITGTPAKAVENFTIAKKVTISISIPVTSVSVLKEAASAAVTIAAAVQSIQVAAPQTALTVAESATVENIKVEQTAENAELKVDGTVKKEVKVEAPKSKVTVGEKAKVEDIKVEKTAGEANIKVDGTVKNLTTDGEKVSIGGKGNIEKTKVNGNNTVIDSDIKTEVSVSDNVTGTEVAGSPVSGGSTTTTGGSTGGSTGGGGGYVPPYTPPTQTPEETVTKSITKTFTSTNSMPNFKVTYNDGKVVVYTISKEEVKAYYNDANKKTLNYTKIEYNTEHSFDKPTETTVEAPVTTNGITSATVTIDEFKCVAKVNPLTKQADVTVSTTSTTIEEISFVNSFAREAYYKGYTVNGNGSEETGAILIIDDKPAYSVDFNDLQALQAGGNKETTIKYHKNIGESLDTLNWSEQYATVVKVSDNRAYFTVDDIKFEIYIEEKKVYVTASSDTEYTEFTLGHETTK